MAQVSYGTITITDIPSSGSTNQHFWFNPTQQGTLLAGAYVTDTDIDTFKVNKSGGYVLIRSNGVEFGKGNYKSIELIAGTLNDSLNFYEPNSNTIDASLTSSGFVLSKGGVEAGTKDSSDYIYVNSNDDATNHTLSINNSGNKSDWRIVAGDKFGVDKAGNLYTSGAYITDISASNISAGTLSADRIGAGTITADKLDATNINASNSLSIGALSSDTQNSILNSKIYENAGYRYIKDIIIYGESNKYYPVYFNNNQDEYNQNIPHEILITRTYAEQAPDDWNTSTHKGGLTLNIKWNYGGWGGATYKAEILAFNEMYSTMVGDVIVGTGSGMLSAVYLRGGGSTGALYHIASDIKIDSTRYGSSFPLIGTTAGATIMQTGSYSWTVPSALTTPNTTHINSLIAENTASSYITYINATDGIKIHNSSDTTNYARVNSDGLQVYKSDTQVASFGDTTIIGNTNRKNYIEITEKHFYMNNNAVNFRTYVAFEDFRDDNNKAKMYEEFNYTSTISSYGYIFLSSSIDTTMPYTIKVNDVTESSESRMYARGDRIYFKSYTSFKEGDIISINYYTIATDAQAFAFGHRDDSNGVNVLGNSPGIRSFTLGSNIASGSGSFAAGNHNKARGSYSIAFGYYTTAQGSESITAGNRTKAYGACSVALGFNTIANRAYQLACGQYNDTSVYNEFVVGCGSSDELDNGFEVSSGSTYAKQMYVREDGVETSSGSYATWSVLSRSGKRYLRLCKTGSSERYKENISLVTDNNLNPEKLYYLPVRQFQFKEGVLSKNDPYNLTRHMTIGFIAEEVEKYYPVACIKREGRIEDWDVRYIVPAMLSLIQEQHKEIEELKSCVKKLQS